MAGIDINKKVKAGLAKAIDKTSSASADKVYLQVATLTAGNPVNPSTETIESVLLVDAIFKSYDKALINGTSILTGDRMLVCNGDVEIKQGQIITAGGDKWQVESVDEKTPAGVPLAYIAQVRKQ